MSNKLIKYLILFLVLALALVAVLVYVGSERVISFELLEQAPATGQYITLQLFVTALAALVLASIILWSLFRLLLNLPAKMKSGIDKKRQKSGFDALEEAQIALENGNIRRALKLAKKADDILKKPGLTTLLLAKAAEQIGDIELARQKYEVLSKGEKTKTAGLRGLARISANMGDHISVIEKAKSVFSSDKSSKWAFDDLFGAQISATKWADALETLQIAEGKKLVEKDKSRRMRAVLLSAEADRLDKSGNPSQAIDLAIKSVELEPSFAPAAALAARLLARNGDNKKAAKIIERAWNKSPHPALSQAYRDLFVTMDKKDKAKKIKQLVKQNPNNRESKILLAELALERGDGVEALSVLDELLHGDNVSARLCLLASQAEEVCQNPIDARSWQIRATTAPLEADWSDLDPEGDAFSYNDDDWKQLIKSYGETASLIHPRLISGARRRAIIKHSKIDNLAITEEDTKTDEQEKTMVFDKPENDKAESLATRLEKLLERKNK